MLKEFFLFLIFFFCVGKRRETPPRHCRLFSIMAFLPLWKFNENNHDFTDLLKELCWEYCVLSRVGRWWLYLHAFNSIRSLKTIIDYVRLRKKRIPIVHPPQREKEAPPPPPPPFFDSISLYASFPKGGVIETLQEKPRPLPAIHPIASSPYSPFFRLSQTRLFIRPPLCSLSFRRRPRARRLH